MVTIAAVAIILPTILSVFYVILQQQAKISKLAEVKRQGDFVISTIESVIRNNAVVILDNATLPEAPVCSTPGSSNSDGVLTFKDKYGNRFGFTGTPTEIDPYTIAPAVGTVPTPPFSPEVLTTNKILFTDPLALSCGKENLYTAPIVKIQFTIQYNTNSNRPEDQVFLPYETSIALRNFGTP